MRSETSALGVKFQKWKERAIKLKNKTISFGAEKLAKSSMVIKTKEDLEKIISKSKTTTFTDKETWEQKESIHHSIVIFVKKDSDFYKSALIHIPVLATKAFASNINLKMCNIDIKDLQDYKITENPSLTLFTDEKFIKTITWKENIEKIVKKLNLNILEAIDNFK